MSSDLLDLTDQVVADEQLLDLTNQVAETTLPDLTAQIEETPQQKVDTIKQDYNKKVLDVASNLGLQNSDEVNLYNDMYNSLDPQTVASFETKMQGKTAQDKFVELQKVKKSQVKEEKTLMQNLNEVKTNIARGFTKTALETPSVIGKVGMMAGEYYKDIASDPFGKAYAFMNKITPQGMLSTGVAKLNEKLFKNKIENPNVSNHFEKLGIPNKIVGEKIFDVSKKLFDNNQEWLKTTPDLEPTSDSPYAQFSYAVGSGIVSLGEATAITLITKSPVAASVAFGSQAAADTYFKAKEQGLSNDDAFNNAFLSGIIEGGLESVSLGKLMSPIKSKFIKHFIENVMVEAGTEGMQELKGNLIDKYNLNIKDTKVMDNVLMSMAVGGLLGGGMSTINVAANKLISKKLEAKGIVKEAQPELFAMADQLLQKVDAKNPPLDNGIKEQLQSKGYTQEEVSNVEKYYSNGLLEFEEIIDETLSKTDTKKLLSPDMKDQLDEVLPKFQPLETNIKKDDEFKLNGKEMTVIETDGDLLYYKRWKNQKRND